MLSEQDFVDYRVRWRTATRAQLGGGDRTVYSTPLPATGFLAAFVVQVLDGMSGLRAHSSRSYFWLVEAFKYAFARRTALADPDFVTGVQAVRDITLTTLMLILKDSNLKYSITGCRGYLIFS